MDAEEVQKHWARKIKYSNCSEPNTEETRSVFEVGSEQLQNMFTDNSTGKEIIRMRG